MCVGNRVHVYTASSVAVDRRCSTTTRPSQLNEHSTLKSLCPGSNNRSDLARRLNNLPSAATWFRLCEAKQRTLPRAQSIPGLTASHNHLEHDIKPTRTSFHLYSPPSSELSQSFYSYPNHQSKTGMVLKNTTCLIIKETNIS